MRALVAPGSAPLAVLLAAGLAAAPALACRVTQRASIPLGQAGHIFTVPVSVDGTTLRFVLDTGAERSVIGAAAADAVHLARDEWVSTDIKGLGGRDRRRLGLPRSLTLGGIALRRHTVAGDSTLVVGPIPDAVAGVPVSGLLGQDFLSAFDADIDPAAQTLTLYDVAGCAGAFIPWAAQAHALPAGRPVRNILTLPVTVNGQTLQAELDTGADPTALLAPGLTKLGLVPGTGGTAQGFGPATVRSGLHSLALRVGGTTLPDWPVAAIPAYGLRSVDMLLGADWFRHQRVWISWATNQVFVAN